MHSMKKVLSVLLAIIIVFSFCSCANSSSDNDSSGSGSSNNSLFSKKDTEPLNAQNFVSRLKDSDGFLYSFLDLPVVFYFLENDSKFKIARIEDYETLSVDYQALSDSEFEYYIEIYNDSHYSISERTFGDSSYSCTLTYADPENRFIIFTDDNDDETDIFMSKEAMKSFLKNHSALVEKYSSEEELEVLYPSTLEGLIKLITDCIESAN